jgi:hypothetical protein
MSGWSYECPCGWSMRQLPEQSNADVFTRVQQHQVSHEMVRYLALVGR